MAAQFTPISPRPTRPNPSGLLLVLLLGGLLRQAAIPLCGLFCALVGQFLRTLPSLILAAVHAHQACALDYPRLLGCFQLLASSGSLFYCLVGGF